MLLRPPHKRGEGKTISAETREDGSIEIVSLPELGIKGNSHFAMMERNNAEVAEVIHKSFAGKGLVD